MSINEGTDKDVLHIYNGILLTIKKNETLSAATWMALEIIILSEVRQRLMLCDITYMLNLTF